MSSSIIDIKGLTRDFYVGSEVVRALRGVDFSVKKNEYVAMMGPSGSGKSTLMNLLGCLDTASSGQYRLNNIDVRSMKENSLARIRNKEIGFIFQTFNLLPRLNAIDNVALPLIYSGYSEKDRHEIAKEVLIKVGLEDRVYHKPNQLSGGQRQRVAVARALVNKPSIILADEPTGNLDSTTSLDIMRLFEEIHRMGNTLIVVTHEQEVASHSHRILSLKDGLVASDLKNKKIITLI